MGCTHTHFNTLCWGRISFLVCLRFHSYFSSQERNNIKCTFSSKRIANDAVIRLGTGMYASENKSFLCNKPQRHRLSQLPAQVHAWKIYQCLSWWRRGSCSIPGPQAVHYPHFVLISCNNPWRSHTDILCLLRLISLWRQQEGGIWKQIKNDKSPEAKSHCNSASVWN